MSLIVGEQLLRVGPAVEDLESGDLVAVLLDELPEGVDGGAGTSLSSALHQASRS